MGNNTEQYQPTARFQRCIICLLAGIVVLLVVAGYVQGVFVPILGSFGIGLCVVGVLGAIDEFANRNSR